MSNSFVGRIKQFLFGGSQTNSSSEINRADWNEQWDGNQTKTVPVISKSSLDGQLDFVQCASSSGLHRMAYRTWGDPRNPKVLLCVHGLTRRGTDFAVLARAMADEYRVVCPDVVGRGDSDFLSNPMLYGVPQYVADMVTLVARLHPDQLDWFGTSMGGLIGMMYGGFENNPIHRMILNDVGPKIDPAFLVRLMTYLGKPISFSTQEKALQYVNEITATFGRHTTEQLNEYNLPQITQKEDGLWHLHYDPQISAPLMLSNPVTAAAGEQALWRSFERITARTLIVRGAESDLLSRSTVEEMCRRNPHASAVEIPEAGHAPAFILPNQVKIARDFFLQK
jgi:cobalt-zinc-cadmium efflux system protein